MKRLHVVTAAVLLSCGLLLLAFQVSCKEAGAPAGKKSVYVVNYPLMYFAQRIAGERVKVVFPAPADDDPAFWMPDARTIEAYQQADLILLNGASYAKWTEKVTLPESKMVDTSQGFKDKYIVIEDAVTHSHGPGGEHTHAGTDFNTWLDPQQAAIQAKAALDALCGLMPEHAAEFEQNFKALEEDLQALDASLKDATSAYEDQPLVASHPVYNYLARHCGWKLKSVRWEPDVMPDEDQWNELDRILKEHPAKWMIWEAPPTAKIVEKLKQHGIDCVVFYHCGNVPQQGDYPEVMQENIERLKPLFGKP